MANKMNFSNFCEFIEFCRTVDVENWTEKEKRDFNEKVCSLIKEDVSFGEKYRKLSANLKKQNIRNNIYKERTMITLTSKRGAYQKKQVRCKSQNLRANVR